MKERSVFCGRVGIVAVGATLLLAPMTGVSRAQTDTGTGGGVTTIQDDNDTDWGWIGLLGLAGLAGLMRKNDHDRVHRTTT